MQGLPNCNISLAFTFLCATNQAKALTFGGAFAFHKKKLAGKNGKGFDKLDKAKKKKITENEHKEDKDQIFESTVSEDISLSRFSVFISLGLWRS